MGSKLRLCPLVSEFKETLMFEIMVAPPGTRNIDRIMVPTLTFIKDSYISIHYIIIYIYFHLCSVFCKEN